MLAASGASVGLFLGLGIIGYILWVLAFAGIFKKAEQPIWAAFIPIVNLFFLLRTVGRPGWWLILYLIPVVDLVIGLIVFWDLAKSFGHGAGVFVLLIFFSFFTMLYLGFSSAQYRGPAAARPAMS